VHTLALTRAGHVWSCGYGLYGQTALQTLGQIVEPARVPGVERITLVSAGGNISLTVAADSRLWSWGDSLLCPHENDSEPGSDTQDAMHIPRALELASFGGFAVLSVSVGLWHSAAMMAAGELWTWGLGFNGCLGLSTLPLQQYTFYATQRVGAGAFAGAHVLVSACAIEHTFVLTDSGAVWTCGAGHTCALGHADMGACHVRTRIAQARSGGSRVVSVVAGSRASMAVTAEGVLYSWGTGALGHGSMHNAVRVPTAVTVTFVPGTSAGLTCSIPPGHCVSMCMGAHARLGAAAPQDRDSTNCVYQAMLIELFKRMATAGRSPGGAYLHMGEGLRRMVAVRLRVA